MKVLLKNLLILILLLYIVGCNNNPKIIKIKGSDTMLPLIENLVGHYKENQIKKYDIVLEGGGSQTGIDALLKGECDIAISSKKISDEDSINIEKNSKLKLLEFDIAFDEILIIVNKGNKIDSINFDNLSKIFAGNITNWNELGGENLEINVFSKSKTSGALSFFEEKVMKKFTLKSDLRIIDKSEDLIVQVGNNRAGIGFIGGGFMSNKIKVLSLSKDSVSAYYAPTEKNVKARYYPLVIPFRLYYLENKENEILKDMIKYLSSKSARYLIMEKGYIPTVDQ